MNNIATAASMLPAAPPVNTPLLRLHPRALRARVAWLAAPERQGRAAGTAGADAAAWYIADSFRRAGLKAIGNTTGETNEYFQLFSFPVGQVTVGQPRLHVNGEAIARGDAGWKPAPSSGSGQLHDVPIVAADAPVESLRDAAVIVIPDPTDRNVTIAAQIAALRDQGVRVVLLARDQELDLPDSASGSDAGIPVVTVAKEAAREWLDSTSHLSLDVQMARQEQTTANVIGILEGSDPVLKEEFIVVGAHYDHLGFGRGNSLADSSEATPCHYGADDNASGVAVVMALAEAFARSPIRPKRSLVFACFGAEERGLLGSAHYILHPPIPLAQTIAMLNLDMIGRLRSERLSVLGTGTSPDWLPLLERVNKEAHLTLNGTSNVAMEVGGSDHQTFIKASIPTLFFFTGLHADYHKPTDTADKINGAGMARVGAFVAGVARGLADGPTRPAFTAPPPSLVTPPSATGRPRPALGTVPEYGADVVGVRLSAVRADSPADKAGLRTGDVLTALGGRSLRGVEEFAGALMEHRPGDSVEIVFTRKGKTRRVSAVLEESSGRR